MHLKKKKKERKKKEKKKAVFIKECKHYLTSLFPCTTAYCDRYYVYSSLKVDQSKGKVQATRFYFSGAASSAVHSLSLQT